LKLLVLGGTKFVGRTLVAHALSDGHDVTLLHRGQTNDDLFPEAEHVHADRDGGLDALGTGGFDACVDVSGYVPRVVRQSAELLRERVGRYVFVSSVSVYSNVSEPRDEDGPLATLDDETVEAITGETYGALKVLCEHVVTEVYRDRSVLARPTFVVGPHDHTGRFSWWVHRGARGGEMLVPEGSAWRIELIDVRDLARFLLLAASDSSLAGAYNVVGPAVETGLVDVVEDAASLADAPIAPVVVADEFLVEHGVTTEQLPLWIPEPDWAAWAHTSGERALAAGLVHTPVVETIHATLDGAATVEGVGLTPEREQDLLAAWHGR
jgi:nucleoside-diphosphate-sugar epimerase